MSAPPATSSSVSACAMRCSSIQRSAVDSPASTCSSSARAESSCCCAASRSISDAFAASSTSAMARSNWTVKKPGPVANSTISSEVTWTRVEPAPSVATSGACRARTPISPSAPGTISISAAPSYAAPSGVTIETSNLRRSSAKLGGRAGGLALACLPTCLGGILAARLHDGLVDRADHVERLLRQLVVLAVDDLLEALDRVLDTHVDARLAGERLRDVHRLREEPLDLPGTLHDELVLVRELVHAEDRDDVLEVLVSLEDLLDACRGVVVLVRDDAARECARRRVERVDRRVDPLLGDRPRQHDERVEVRERVRRRRVREVVRGHVDRLHRRDGSRARGRDALLELAHLRRERRLVADRARHAPEQRRDLGARLHEAEDVVDKEQRVLTLVAEILRHRQPGEADAQTRARRLVHLAVHERDLVDDAGLRHLEVEVVALARALADAGEDRHAAVLHRDVVDQLLDQHRLAEPGAAEEAD